MKVDLLTLDEVRHTVRNRVFGCEWWLVPLIDAASSRLMTEIEERFYSSQHSADFEILTGPFPMAFARKRSMSAEDLVGLLRELGADSAADPSTDNDILLAYEMRDPYAAFRADAWMAAWNAWLGPEHEPRADRRTPTGQRP